MTNNFRRKERVREMAEKSIDIAKETSVQTVLTDTASLKATADTINTNTQSAKTDSSAIKSRMGTASDGTSTATLFGKINKLLEGSGISVADVKAYLNSTVGTSNEKSLDEMIKDELYDYNEYVLEPGEITDERCLFDGYSINKSTQSVRICSFTPDVTGKYKFYSKIKNTDASGYIWFYVSTRSSAPSYSNIATDSQTIGYKQTQGGDDEFKEMELSVSLTAGTKYYIYGWGIVSWNVYVTYPNGSTKYIALTDTYDSRSVSSNDAIVGKFTAPYSGKVRFNFEIYGYTQYEDRPYYYLGIGNHTITRYSGSKNTDDTSSFTKSMLFYKNEGLDTQKTVSVDIDVVKGVTYYVHFWSKNTSGSAYFYGGYVSYIKKANPTPYERTGTIIKSIQNAIYSSTDWGNETYGNDQCTISINTVNPNKTVVFADTLVLSKGTNKIILYYPKASIGTQYSCQVVEFY